MFRSIFAIVMFCILGVVVPNGLAPSGNPGCASVQELRRDLQQALIDRDSLPIQDVKDAIDCLGSMRTPDAVPELIALLDFHYEYFWENEVGGAVQQIHPLTPIARYPAIGALCDIGEPAVPSLIETIAQEDLQSLRSQNAVAAIGVIFRDDPKKATHLLDEAAAAESSSNTMVADRLREAARQIRSRQ